MNHKASVEQVRVEDLHKSYGDHEVLKGVSRTAISGDVISIIGSSGSGKSTWLRCINFLECPTAGRILVAGKEVELVRNRKGELTVKDARQLQQIRTRLSMVFQHFNLWSHMTVLENVVEAPVHVLGISRDEAEAVLAHEVSHVANGDMVTLTLIQGVVNTFVIYISRVLAGIVSNFLRSDDEESSASGGIAYFAISMVFELVFGILASMIVMWFSRQREFRADAGSAQLVGKEKMIAALERLARSQDSQLDGTMMAFGINGKSSMTELFMSHPPLEKRIQALREMR